MRIGEKYTLFSSSSPLLLRLDSSLRGWTAASRGVVVLLEDGLAAGLEDGLAAGLGGAKIGRALPARSGAGLAAGLGGAKIGRALPRSGAGLAAGLGGAKIGRALVVRSGAGLAAGLGGAKIWQVLVVLSGAGLAAGLGGAKIGRALVVLSGVAIATGLPVKLLTDCSLRSSQSLRSPLGLLAGLADLALARAPTGRMEVVREGNNRSVTGEGLELSGVTILAGESILTLSAW